MKATKRRRSASVRLCVCGHERAEHAESDPRECLRPHASGRAVCLGFQTSPKSTTRKERANG